MNVTLTKTVDGQEFTVILEGETLKEFLGSAKIELNGLEVLSHDVPFPVYEMIVDYIVNHCQDLIKEEKVYV